MELILKYAIFNLSVIIKTVMKLINKFVQLQKCNNTMRKFQQQWKLKKKNLNKIRKTKQNKYLKINECK